MAAGSTAKIILPNGRTGRYHIWRACERLGILPPQVEARWEDMDWFIQTHILEYESIRQLEEAEMASSLLSTGL